MNVLALMMATAATTLTGCAVRQPAPAAPKPGEEVVRSPTQPPAEVDPPHRDPGDLVEPAPPPPADPKTPS